MGSTASLSGAITTLVPETGDDSLNAVRPGVGRRRSAPTAATGSWPIRRMVLASMSAASGMAVRITTRHDGSAMELSVPLPDGPLGRVGSGREIESR
jgi:hypothetical protein